MAKEKKIGDLTVNDGHGLLDNEGLCDSIVEDLNNLLKNIAAGQYIRVSSLVLEMVQKLMNLKKGIRNDRKSLEDQLEDLRRLNNELAEKAFKEPIDRENETIAEE
jgi:hypothetical protein